MPSRSQRHMTQMLRPTSGGVQPITLGIYFTGFQAPESVASGAALGTLSTQGTTGTAAFTLTNSDGNRVALTGANNASVIRGATAWDFETHPLVTFTVSVSGVTPTIAPTSFQMICSNVLETVLNALTLSANTVAEGSPLNTVVGAIQNRTSGSTLTLINNGNERFAISGTNLVTSSIPTDYETTTSHSITIRETHPDAAPRDTSFTINVTNVLEGSLNALTLNNNAVNENVATGTTVGTLQGITSGSTLALTVTAGGKFALSGTSIVTAGALDYETATSHSITVRETLAEAANSPRDTVLTINVGDVFEAGPPTLAALTLSASTIAENSVTGTVVGTVQGTTAGSTLSLTDTAGSRFALSGASIVAGSVSTDFETATTHNITIREALAGATNTPRDTVLAITVTNVADGLPPTITSSTTQTVAENAPFSLNLTASEAGTWAITGGADAAMFEIAGSSVSAEALDFELPEDANGDNVYDVQVTFTATATGLTDTKTFHLTVTDVAEGGTTLAALTLSANTIVESSAAGTLVGTIAGQTAGSALTLFDNAGNRFAFETTIPAGADALWYADQANTTAIRQYVPNEITKATIAVPTWVNANPKPRIDYALSSVTQTTDLTDSYGGHNGLRLVCTGASWYVRDPITLAFKAMSYTVVVIGKTNAGGPQTAKLNFGFTPGGGTTVTFNTTPTRVSHTAVRAAGGDQPFILSSSGADADITIERWFVYEGATDPFAGDVNGEQYGGHLLFGGAHAYVDRPTVAANEVDINSATALGQVLFDSFRSLTSFTAFATVHKVAVTTSGINTVYAGLNSYGDMDLSVDYSKGVGFYFKSFGALCYRQPFDPGVNTLFELLNKGYNVLVWKYDAATTTASFWVNDVLIGGEIIARAALADFQGMRFNLVNPRSSVKWNSGAFYPTALSRANIESVVTTLRTKATANSLTLDPTSRFIFFEGDSNTDGSTNGAPGGGVWPHLFTPNASAAFHGSPLAMNGGKLSDMVARALFVNAAVPTAKAGRKFILVGMIGTNDASTNYTSDAATYSANLLAYWGAARTAGWITIGIPILPRTDINVAASPPFDTWRGTINSNLVAAVGTQLDACLNPASVPLLFANGASDNTTYFKTDKVHLTVGAGTTGQATLEAALRPIINSFL